MFDGTAELALTDAGTVTTSVTVSPSSFVRTVCDVVNGVLVGAEVGGALVVGGVEVGGG